MNKSAANSTLAISGVSSLLDSFVIAESSVLRMNICAENPARSDSYRTIGIGPIGIGPIGIGRNARNRYVPF